MHRCIAGIVVAVLTIATVSAQTLYIPASAYADGANQTTWRTDLQVKTVADAPAAFTIELLKTGVDNSEPAAIERTLAAGESLRLRNVLETGFGFVGTSALRITATDGGILANSRTYNDDPGGTYGQTVPAVAEGNALGFGSDATLIQLSRSADPSAGFRTNIGFVNTVGSSTAIEVDVFEADGTHLGSLTRNLPPFGHRQINDVFHAVGADNVPDGYATVGTTSEDGRFIAYASVVDNGSGDAVFVLGGVEVAPVPPDSRLVVFESFMRDG